MCKDDNSSAARETKKILSPQIVGEDNPITLEYSDASTRDDDHTYIDCNS